MKLNKILTVGMIASTFMLTACSWAKDDMSKKDAKAEVEAYYKKIGLKTAKLKKDISNTSLNESEELPKIDKSYPYTVDGDGDINAEIFVSSEKAGNGKDGIINEIAEDFNSENQTINGKKISVSIRSVPSGTAVDYISTKNHVPDGYTPSNAQWDYILSAKGVQSTEITDRLFGNTSGLLMKDKVYDNLKSKYGGVA